MRVAGIGLRAGTSLDSLRQILTRVEALAGPADALASLPEKLHLPALQALAAERVLPLHGAGVAGVETPTRSARIQALHGTGSVAEAAALLLAHRLGRGRAHLIVPRLTAEDGMATCAMAQTSDFPSLQPEDPPR